MVSGKISKQKIQKVKIPEIEKFAIYYGYPSLVNDAKGNLEQAINTFKQYDTIIFGAGLELNKHADHNNTSEIITALKDDTTLFGYISLDMTSTHFDIKEIQDRIQLWKKMNVKGIFYDSAGYDYGVTRKRQNDAINAAHSTGLIAFVNAFDPTEIFSPDPYALNDKGGGNPRGIKPVLGDGDYFLHESFQVQDGQFVDPEFWAAKSQKAFHLSKDLKVNHMTTTVSSHDIEFHQSHLNYAWWSTLLWGFQGFSWAEKSFSSADNKLPMRERPSVDVGKHFVEDVIINGHLYTRRTDRGNILIDGDNHYGSFSETT